MGCHECGDLRNGVETVVVFFQRVAIAVAVEVVDHRILFGLRLIAGRQEDSILALFAENFGIVNAVVVRLGGIRRKRKREYVEEFPHSLYLTFSLASGAVRVTTSTSPTISFKLFRTGASTEMNPGFCFTAIRCPVLRTDCISGIIS